MANTRQSPTIAELAELFLSQLSPEERAEVQIEVSKFVKWLGSSRPANNISPVDVAGYREYIAPSAVKPIKSFLTYARKQGLSNTNLALHLKAKKISPKPGGICQTTQIEATLTPEGYAELQKELADLKVQRSRLIEEIQKAAADKDFRENAPLHAARESKAHVEGRIKEIEAILNQAKIVVENQDTSRVKFGDTVVLRDLSSGKELTYTLVDPREANPAKGKLSVASPLGKAILDKQKGQTVEVVAPAGSFSCRIEDIVGSPAEKTASRQET